MRHQLLAGARLSPDEHGGARGGDLRHLLVDRLHGPAAADDVADVVALGQLAPELGVLVEEALPLRLHEVVDAHRLADHRAHDPEELGLLVVAAVLLVGERHPEGTHRPVLGPDGHADVRHLGPPGAAEDTGAVEEEGLPAHLGDDHRPAALRDPAHDPLAEAVAGVPDRGAAAARGLDREVARLLVAQDDGGGERPPALLQDGEDPLEGGPQVQRAPEGLADLEQVGQLPRVGGAGSHGGIMTELSAPTTPVTKVSTRARPGRGYGRKPKPKRGEDDAAAERARLMALNQPWAMTW